jgi:hypothetical protein
MALDPNISLGVRPLQVPDPLAQMAQVSQIQSAQRQGEVSRMQLEDLKNDRIEMQQFQSQIIANGGNADLDLLAKTMLKTPKFFAQGVELTKKLKEQAEFETVGRRLYPELFGATAPAGMPAAPAPTAIGAPTPVNALATGAAPTAAPVNALAAPSSEPYPGYNQAIGMTSPAAPARTQQLSPSGKTRQQLEGLIFMAQKNPLFKGMAETAKLELAEMMKAPVYHRVPNVGLVNPITKEVVMAEGAAPTTLARLQAELALLPKGDPRIPAYQAMIKKETEFAPRPITNVNLPTQEKAEQADRGKMLVAEFGDISKAAKLAAKTLPSIDANLSILDKGFSTGFGTETVAAGAKVLAALGVADADKFATNAQVFQAKATEAVLQKQLEQKGPQTESDAQRIDQIGAQLGKTTAGNRFVLTTAKEQLKRDMEQRDFYAKWWQKNKTYDGAEDAWFSGEGGKSLFDRPALKAYAKSAEAVAAPPAANRQSLDNIFAPKK